MACYPFETVDVFARSRFGGNPLAVFTDASGLTDEQMQALAAEFNLSETTFVLPPVHPANTAQVRIFNRTAEMAFAGHPTLGTGYLLAAMGLGRRGVLQLEVPAGLVRVQALRDARGQLLGAEITAPQPLSIGEMIPAETVAACVGLEPRDIVEAHHPPLVASMGNPYVLAQVDGEALLRCSPDVRAFRRAREAHPTMSGRFSLHLYARFGQLLRARMFAPLAGTYEDPATGSANAPLAALLLFLAGGEQAEFTVRQGEEMGRPSLMKVMATQRPEGVVATLSGRCIRVLRGEAVVDQGDQTS